jgi:hypothetical protein
MTLQLLHSEFPYIWGFFFFISVQCAGSTAHALYEKGVPRSARVCQSAKSSARVQQKCPRGVITGLPAGQHFCRHTVSDSQFGKIDCALSISWVANCYRHFVYLQKNIRVSRGWIYAKEGENVVQAYLHRHCYCAVLNFFSYQTRHCTP